MVVPETSAAAPPVKSPSGLRYGYLLPLISTAEDHIIDTLRIETRVCTSSSRKGIAARSSARTPDNPRRSDQLAYEFRHR